MARRGMDGRRAAAIMAWVLGVVATIPVDAQTTRKLPYWAALSKDEARMRVGPSMDYPANWVYRRRNLPVKVIEVYPNWRRIEDPSGTRGWMHVRLLKDERTAVVVGGVAAMRAAASDDAPMLWRAAPGVVGHPSDCTPDWCAFDVAGQRGYVHRRSLWGATEE